MIDKNSVSVILCAGKGSRMNSARPKVLNTICGKSMLGYILDAQIESGISDWGGAGYRDGGDGMAGRTFMHDDLQRTSWA